ncbi:MAG: ATP-binding cassette domain-containing protein, partial [Myxococcota bacterium]
GETIAIVGRSGSGKSTLAKLLMGVHSPTQGRIVYDGTDLEELDHRALRTELGIVPQHPFIFGRSIRENIALHADDVELAAVQDAARRAAIHEDIAALPLAYDTIVADGGASLSGGQRQRIAIARALLKRPPLIVLDEATSSVDNATEKRIMDELSRLDCARILIAHRLSTVANADQIVVLERGKVVEVGTHGALMSRRGVYYGLVAAQVHDVPPEEGVYRGSSL